MARVNFNILRISDLKWTGMGEFNSDDHYLYYCGQESLRRNGAAIMVNKRVWNAVLDAISKMTEWSLFPRQTIQYHWNPNLCPDQKCWRSWSWMVLWKPTRPSRTNTPKRCPFLYRGLECKSRKSRNTWSYRQIWTWSTEWSRAQEIALVIANTLFQQHKEDCTQDHHRWSTPKSDWLYSLQPKMEKLYIVNKNKTGSWLWLRLRTPYCQIQTYIEESGKTTRPFRYDLKQIPN